MIQRSATAYFAVVFAFCLDLDATPAVFAGVFGSSARDWRQAPKNAWEYSHAVLPYGDFREAEK